MSHAHPAPQHQQPYPPQHGAPPPPPPPSAPPSRPVFVVVVSAVTLLSALFSLIGAAIVYTGGKDFVDEHLREVMDENPEAVGLPAGVSASDIKSTTGSLWYQTVSDYQDTLTIRAGMASFFALALVLFAVFVLRTGARWARVMITIVAVVQLILPHTLILGDEPPDSLFATSFPAVLLGLAALVLVWLPPVGRFGKEHKLARSPQVRLAVPLQGMPAQGAPVWGGGPTAPSAAQQPTQPAQPAPRGHRRRR